MLIYNMTTFTNWATLNWNKIILKSLLDTYIDRLASRKMLILYWAVKKYPLLFLEQKLVEYQQGDCTLSRNYTIWYHPVYFFVTCCGTMKSEQAPL